MDDAAKHKIAADLSRLIARLGPNTKGQKASQQLAKLRQEVSRIAIKESAWLCNCESITVVESWRCEEFAAKMQILCPIHGPGRLGVIVVVTGMPEDCDPMDKKLAGLLREYDRKCAAWSKKGPECRVKNQSAKR